MEAADTRSAVAKSIIATWRNDAMARALTLTTDSTGAASFRSKLMSSERSVGNSFALIGSPAPLGLLRA
jgi:hypothetical protein